MTRASITIGPLDATGDARRAAYLLVPMAVWGAATTGASRVAAWHRRRQINRAVGSLSRMSDRMLKDIGVARAEIEFVARHGRDPSNSRW